MFEKRYSAIPWRHPTIHHDWVVLRKGCAVPREKGAHYKAETTQREPAVELHIFMVAGRMFALSVVNFVRFYAARTAFGPGTERPPRETLTILDTPGSCMVTPYITSACSMVRLE